MKINIKYWIQFSLFNLLIVAFLGTVMRYKIGFEFPFFNQKNIQHAHSHFAFLGWIAHAIYILMLHTLIQKNVPINQKKYCRLLVVNMVCSYGMLVSFLISGYGLVSIILSSIAIFVNYVFSYALFIDFKKLNKEDYFANWFKAALLFNVFSTLGTYGLAYIIGTKHFNQHWYLASLYFYLHFQYNGFFTFASLGLLLFKIPDWFPNFKYDVKIFWYFFAACIPAYFLSTLWAGLPIWLYVIIIVAAIIQFLAWLKMLISLIKTKYVPPIEFKKVHYLMIVVAIAFTAKLLLQVGSTVPAISKMAFGFRPIVIAYLHLILLAIISVFLLTYMYANKFILNHLYSRVSLIVFVVGVYLNEVILGIQGIASLSYTALPYVNQLLFAVSVLMFVSMLGLLLVHRNKLE